MCTPCRRLALIALLCSTFAGGAASAQEAAWPAVSEEPTRDETIRIEDPCAQEGACDKRELPRGAAEEPTGISLWTWFSSYDMPARGEDDGPRRGLYSRLRGRVNLVFGQAQVFVEADAFSGRIAGDPFPMVPERVETGTLPRWRVADELNGWIDPRMAFIGYTTPVGLVRVGMQSNEWGLGLLANGGAEREDQLFNQPFGGDRVLRALFATAPLSAIEGFEPGKHLFVAIGADLVWRDDNADFLAGDRAYQGVLSLFYRDEDTTAGFFGVLREQTGREGDQLSIVGLDAAITHGGSLDDADEWYASIGAEIAWLGGETTRALPTSGQSDRTKISGIGAAAEAYVAHRPSSVAIKLLTGWASGDANPDDDTLYRFRFDPNYRVGLILFDTYLPSVSRANYRGVTDLERQGRAPLGADALINEGGVENAFYIQPQLLFGAPDGLLAGIAVLYAVADQPVADLYRSFERGGAQVGPFGRAEAARELGVEVDVALQYRMELWRDLSLQLKAEYGIFFPGEAFEDAAGNSAPPQNLLRARVALTW